MLKNLLELKALGSGFLWDGDAGAGTGGGAGTGTTQQNTATGGQDASGGTTDTEGNEGDTDWIVKDPKKAAGKLADTRKEAKENREKYESALKERDALLKEKQDRERQAEQERQKALTEQGNFKGLYEEAQKRLTEMDALKAAAEEAKAYKDAFQKMYEARVKDVPKPILALLQGKGPLEAMRWLDENPDIVKPPNAPDLDAGKRPQNRGQDYLGSEKHLREAAQRLGIRLPFSGKSTEERK